MSSAVFQPSASANHHRLNHNSNQSVNSMHVADSSSIMTSSSTSTNDGGASSTNHRLPRKPKMERPADQSPSTQMIGQSTSSNGWYHHAATASDASATREFQDATAALAAALRLNGDMDQKHLNGGFYQNGESSASSFVKNAAAAYVTSLDPLLFAAKSGALCGGGPVALPPGCYASATTGSGGSGGVAAMGSASSPDSTRSGASSSAGKHHSMMHNGGGDDGRNAMDDEDSRDAVAAATDAEGVWSADIDQSFHEALAIYPPCGRRKIILSEEGKMYGRNELIARYIKLRTGKTRTRKQVSSHIQVLARKKSRELQSKLKDDSAKEKAMSTLSAMSSAQIVSMSLAASAAVANATHSPSSMSNANCSGAPLQSSPAFDQLVAAAAAASYLPPLGLSNGMPSTAAGSGGAALPFGVPALNRHAPKQPPHVGRSICTPRIRLCEFSAYCLPNAKDETKRHEILSIPDDFTYFDPFLEEIDISQIHDKLPDELWNLYARGGPRNAFFLVKCWADVSFNLIDDQSTAYFVDSMYESKENMTIVVSSKVCSFRKSVIGKVEYEYPKFENGNFVYRIQRSVLCEYMNNFIYKLKCLPDSETMNRVLENFTALQVVTSKETDELLLCIAIVFEVSESPGSQYRVYRLTHDERSSPSNNNNGSSPGNDLAPR